MLPDELSGYLMQAHRDLEREAMRKSLVLLKNGKNGTQPLLPLPKKASRILVVGTPSQPLIQYFMVMMHTIEY
ncbi:unnamed protein product [Linum trigynum]|uniref:Uncharacterized protein n=1 Tax=Linum trigynum TaxID=586398 RepID=A0AAV2D767_9ROSI